MELDFKCRPAVVFIAAHAHSTVTVAAIVVLQIIIENQNNNNKVCARRSCT